MQFLADESCDFLLVKTLREAGHDVLAVSEIMPRAEDSDVIRIAEITLSKSNNVTTSSCIRDS